MLSAMSLAIVAIITSTYAESAITTARRVRQECEKLAKEYMEYTGEKCVAACRMSKEDSFSGLSKDSIERCLMTIRDNEGHPVGLQNTPLCSTVAGVLGK